MTITNINNQNHPLQPPHKTRYDHLCNQLTNPTLHPDHLIEQIQQLQIAIPSWALGAGGTRFGRFRMGGEPTSLEQKIDDVGILHALTRSAGAISLHIPWDVPTDPDAIRQRAQKHGIVFDAVNSNTFQDQPGQQYSYKFGSLCHVDPAIRQQAIEHNIEVIEHGKALGSKALTVWLADGSTFPGQQNFRKAFQNTQQSLHEIYRHLPDDWQLFIEYKPYEPNFYSSVIPDWGTALLLAEACGPKAYVLVDLGHHLPNTNVEQIVATLMMKGRLGGFHFNDSKYGDDDLTCGSIKPYQLFLIFNELIEGLQQSPPGASPLAWMIDASHNVKDPMEDLMQSLEAIRQAYVKALLIDRAALEEAQRSLDVVRCQEILQEAFLTDVRSLVAEARLRSGGALDPIGCYRKLNVRAKLIEERGLDGSATGL